MTNSEHGKSSLQNSHAVPKVCYVGEIIVSQVSQPMGVALQSIYDVNDIILCQLLGLEEHHNLFI